MMRGVPLRAPRQARALSSNSWVSRQSAVFAEQPSPHALPAGFRASGVAAGVKKREGALDVAVLASERPCTAAAVFTTNRFQAAPVLVSRRVVEQHGAGGLHAVAVNAGCANACTGDRGLEDAEDMAREAEAAGGPALVMSTGVIGEYLPMDRVRAGVRDAVAALAETEEGWRDASRAIMTTDTLPKLVSERAADGYAVMGTAKGSGMIHPNMATMLAVVATDAAVSRECLELALREGNERSFNSITVDGDTSTNDTLAVLANGASGAPLIDDPRSPEFARFRDTLGSVLTDLAKLIVRDGEGATKFVEVRVRGAATKADARSVAEAVARSPLVKTALFGSDANWGRIVCAVGYSGVPVEPERVNLWLRDQSPDGASDGGDLHLFRDGTPHADEEHASRLMARTDIALDISIGMGDAEATMYTSDLSYDYVRINGDYRS